jgi:hypothetical protein
MLIRHLIVAALAASACAAHADVIPASGSAGATATQSGILSSWKGANGADVLSSGVLSGNVSLIGGITYSAASKSSGNSGTATLADVLYGKASANIGQTADGQTALYYKQGIEGMYLLGSGHGILAAMLGTGVSVVGSSDGVIISKGQSGTGASTGGGGGGSYAGGFTGSPGASGGATGGTTGGGMGNGAIVEHTGGNGNGNGAGSVTLPVPAAIPPIGAGNGPIVSVPQDTPGAAIPEPSSVALMLAGLLGAGALKRRRQR